MPDHATISPNCLKYSPSHQAIAGQGRTARSDASAHRHKEGRPGSVIGNKPCSWREYPFIGRRTGWEDDVCVSTPHQDGG